MFWLLFRSLWLALIALAPNLLAAGLVLGVMGLAGIPLDIMTITIAAIVVGIGVDDCVHYVLPLPARILARPRLPRHHVPLPRQHRPRAVLHDGDRRGRFFGT
jgi:hypothetical protein